MQNGIELRDSNGIVRLMIALAADGIPFISLFDAHGCERLVLSLTSTDNPNITLREPNGSPVVGIGVDELWGSVVSVFGKEYSRPQITIGVKNNNDYGITIFDENGNAFVCPCVPSVPCPCPTMARSMENEDLEVETGQKSEIEQIDANEVSDETFPN